MMLTPEQRRALGLPSETEVHNAVERLAALTPEPAGGTAEILEGLKRQVHDVMYTRGPVSDAEWRLGSVLACVIDIMIHERSAKTDPQ